MFMSASIPISDFLLALMMMQLSFDASPITQASSLSNRLTFTSISKGPGSASMLGQVEVVRLGRYQKAPPSMVVALHVHF